MEEQPKFSDISQKMREYLKLDEELKSVQRHFAELRKRQTSLEMRLQLMRSEIARALDTERSEGSAPEEDRQEVGKETFAVDERLQDLFTPAAPNNRGVMRTKSNLYSSAESVGGQAKIVLNLIDSHPERTWTHGTLLEKVQSKGIKPESLSTFLSRLRRSKLIGGEGKNYWSLNRTKSDSAEEITK